MSDAYVPDELIPIMQPLQTVLISEFSVPFTPISSWGGLKPFDWSHVQITRPRFRLELPPPADGCGSSASSQYIPPAP